MCPSQCGGAACDPVSDAVHSDAAIEDPLSSLTVGLTMERQFSEQPDYWGGLIGGCGISPGCNASVGGRVRDLMARYLELQNKAIPAVKNIYAAEDTIMQVRGDAIETIIQELEADMCIMMSSRVTVMHKLSIRWMLVLNECILVL